MMTAYSIPSLKSIGILFGGSIVAFGLTIWLTVQAVPDQEINSFLLLLAGLVLLVIALVFLTLRVINQRDETDPPA